VNDPRLLVVLGTRGLDRVIPNSSTLPVAHILPHILPGCDHHLFSLSQTAIGRPKLTLAPQISRFPKADFTRVNLPLPLFPCSLAQATLPPHPPLRPNQDHIPYPGAVFPLRSAPGTKQRHPPLIHLLRHSAWHGCPSAHGSIRSDSTETTEPRGGFTRYPCQPSQRCR
jgi:hypothetical protein